MMSSRFLSRVRLLPFAALVGIAALLLFGVPRALAAHGCLQHGPPHDGIIDDTPVIIVPVFDDLCSQGRGECRFMRGVGCEGVRSQVTSGDLSPDERHSAAEPIWRQVD
jgi:hypothetical protein